MSDNSLFETAMELESNGKYSEALELFELLLSSSDYDKGDLRFHCGWCLENIDPEKIQTVLNLYEQAIFTTTISLCRMNSLFRCGWLTMQNKDYLHADGYFRKAIELHEAEPIDEGIYHQSLYWYAVCRESLGYYLEAIKIHKYLQEVSPMLNPESRCRQINCLFQIGSFTAALKICQSFNNAPPEGFDKTRYEKLRHLAELEYRSLYNYLDESY